MNPNLFSSPHFYLPEQHLLSLFYSIAPPLHVQAIPVFILPSPYCSILEITFSGFYISSSLLSSVCPLSIFHCYSTVKLLSTGWNESVLRQLWHSNHYSQAMSYSFHKVDEELCLKFPVILLNIVLIGTAQNRCVLSLFWFIVCYTSRRTKFNISSNLSKICSLSLNFLSHYIYYIW